MDMIKALAFIAMLGSCCLIGFYGSRFLESLGVPTLLIAVILPIIGYLLGRVTPDLIGKLDR